VFLEVGARLLTTRDNLEVVVVGDGEDLPRYRAQYDGRGIDFKGYLDGIELTKAIQYADICYSDVWSEIGSPVKILEYMAGGRCIVAQDTPSTREWIRNGIDGVLCAGGEAPLMDAIETLLDDPDLRSRLGAAARQRLFSIIHSPGFQLVAARYEALASAGS
jgi:glycosyltransferase involved in cell wall biosynthesis